MTFVLAAQTGQRLAELDARVNRIDERVRRFDADLSAITKAHWSEYVAAWRPFFLERQAEIAALMVLGAPGSGAAANAAAAVRVGEINAELDFWTVEAAKHEAFVEAELDMKIKPIPSPTAPLPVPNGEPMPPVFPPPEAEEPNRGSSAKHVAVAAGIGALMLGALYLVSR